MAFFYSFNMKKKVLLFIIGFILSSASYSQEVDSLLSLANEQYQSKKYIQAAKTFNGLYQSNCKEELYLYYAATSAVTGKDYSLALNYYLKLDSLNYTGITKEYFAKNKKTKKQEKFSSKQALDLAIKNKTHKNQKSNWSNSKRSEILKNIALIYTNLNENDKALKAIRRIRNNNKRDLELLKAEASINYKLGFKDEFANLLKEGLKIDNKNTNFIYNLGVLSQEAKNFKVAKKYYKKVLKINPKHLDALANMSTILVNGEVDIVNEMNSLGLSKAESKRYDLLLKKRKKLVKKALPYLEAIIENDQSNIPALEMLKDIYNVLGNNIKRKKMEVLLKK